MKVQWTGFLTSLHKITLDWLTKPLKSIITTEFPMQPLNMKRFPFHVLDQTRVNSSPWSICGLRCFLYDLPKIFLRNLKNQNFPISKIDAYINGLLNLKILGGAFSLKLPWIFLVEKPTWWDMSPHVAHFHSYTRLKVP